MGTAARLLAEGQLSIAAVAERVGYGNPVAFAKAFARMQEIGPGAFRRGERAVVTAHPISSRPLGGPTVRLSARVRAPAR